MKIVKFILLLLILAIGVVAALATRKPDEYLYTRSRIIAAKPQALFAQANDLRNFNTWSPWADLDPNAKITYAGAPAGPGASMSWQGNKDVGEGTMTITEATPGKDVTYELEFVKPMAGLAASQLVFTPAEPGTTKVTWSMSGHASFFQKMISVVMDCEAMMGKQFDQGLTNLAAKVEHPAPARK